MDFKIVSDYIPTGDQPEAIKQLAEGISRGDKFQTLLGVTGSGKTFTVANLIEKVQKPTLVLSHNKTLAAQLYGEFKQFFPNNAVEYFVSYYDYYQPEAYLPVTDTYIEKDLSINQEIEKLRLSATSSLLSGRRDVIVVSSVSCIYGIGNPEDFHSNTITVEQGQAISRNKFLRHLVESLYSRSELEFKAGTFRVNGDTIDIYLAYSDLAYRIVFFGDEIEEIESFNPITNQPVETLKKGIIYPANIFVTTKERMHKAIREIQDDLFRQIEFFKSSGKNYEAKRIKERVEYDLEMIKELGYCPGIENYSRYFDGRKPGTRPFCLLDYFPKDYLTVIDESHVTLPQIKAMYGGDFSRKKNLVEYGFRLPAAIDNRPLKFDEFENLVNQILFVSATPADYELEKCEGVVVEQLIRPTGLLDPEVEVRPSLNQIDDLMEEIHSRTEKNQRVLVTTLTKRMAEELTKYLTRFGIKCRYIHSDVDTMERVEIMDQLRNGVFDVLIGINLLREGLDLPEVALVAILDADKEGFLRSARSLTQTSGRAARNIDGRVIMYADKMTDSMKQTIEETTRRREKQLAYNEKNNITPTQIVKASRPMMGYKDKTGKAYVEPENVDIAADPIIKYMNKTALDKAINNIKLKMEKAAKELNFIEAARLRDEMFALQELLKEKN
ncbi:MAG: excinuclease ABC subunit B [Bacteroidetes bacterium GWC2_33_15]|nr:MAG: excinuclease ABC subunit B [Bacteroidetes bacterium GWA2_33_15]OFX52113.1 MAG: excinuclease ABC subunit B [Bacteroidetes bacterium GWC2_33_15]OFX64267.1 MAG: excinuclease ABC subunit B [Bacteroidetes bacterium GWB2_32_14]OFX67672.1 MAG: excinuclease ABC subunit B [Bacteroidetes bacterium GWD2_33_33]HAN19277.1 excinuclease ABC subunit B [Bacteroidales bacterium]